MLCKWQVKKLCIFYIQLSVREGEEVVGDRLGLVFKLLAHSVIFLH